MKIKYLGFCLVSLFILSGCASVTGSYPDRVEPIKNKLSQENYSDAIQKAKDLQSDNNLQIANLELGRSYQLAGQYDLSQKSYDLVLAQVKIDQEKAKIEISRLLSQSGSLFVNPQMVSYRLAPYEIVYLLGYQALNELAMNNKTNALVYLRQAYDEQDYIQQEQAKEILLANQKAEKEGWNFNPQDHAQEFDATLRAASHIKNGFENAWVYYLTALTYFSAGDDNNAFVAIKKALDLAPENLYVRELLLDILIDRGGDLSQLNQYLKNFGLKNPPLIPKNAGLVVILYEQGWVPALSTVKIPLPMDLGKGFQIQWLSLPAYQDKNTQFSPSTLELSENNQNINTAVLMNVYDLAAKNLSDRYPLIFVQAALSVIAKATVTTELSDTNSQATNLLASIAGSVYSTVMSNADCRTWLTLPFDEQIWQGYLPAGDHIFNLINSGSGKQKSIHVSVQPGKISLIWVVQNSGPMDIKIFNLN